MMEEWMERWWLQRKISLVLGAIFLFLVSMVMSCQEMRYMVSGKTAEASLMSDRIERTKGRYGTIHEQRVVRYVFVDGEKSRQEYARVPHEWELPRGEKDNTVRVEYIANRADQSRLAGQRHSGWVVAFAGSVGLMVFGFWWISRPAK